MRNLAQRATPPIYLALVVCVVCVGCNDETTTEPPEHTPSGKIYVANEDSGTVSVIDEDTLRVVATIDLVQEGDGMPMPHNVQVAPDGASVWVTAPPMEMGASAHGGESEHVVVIDPATDTIVRRMAVGEHLHLAHVVVDPAARWAFVTANEAESILRIDVDEMAIDATWSLGAGNTPHGLRWCAGALYVANMAANRLSVVDPQTGATTDVDVGGMAVQTACVADRWVFASLYDTREVVRYAIDGGDLTRIPLPDGAQGPIQLYPSLDGKALYVADQGMLMNRPASNRLFEVDVEAATVRATIEVGAGAHGVVVTNTGADVWVTNTAEGTVSVVDTATRKVRATIEVGDRPNGVTCWHPGGGMP